MHEMFDAMGDTVNVHMNGHDADMHMTVSYAYDNMMTSFVLP